MQQAGRQPGAATSSRYFLEISERCKHVLNFHSGLIGLAQSGGADMTRKTGGHGGRKTYGCRLIVGLTRTDRRRGGRRRDASCRPHPLPLLPAVVTLPWHIGPCRVVR